MDVTYNVTTFVSTSLKIFFNFCLCCFSIYKRNTSPKDKVNENTNKRALFEILKY